MEGLKLHQGSISDMLMENNGKYSITKQKKQIQVQYFFIKDRIDNGDLSLKYCPTGEIFADFFTNPLQGATFRRFWAMMQGITNITPDVYMGCPRAMAKVTSQDFVGKNDRQTFQTASASTDARGGTCTDARRSTCADKQTHRSTSKDVQLSMCVDAQVITFMDVSTESTGVHGNMCSVIYTKGTGVHGSTSMEVFLVNTVIHGSMCAYE